MLIYMANVRGLDDFPPSLVDDMPREVRAAIRQVGRAGAALRLYRRRGWNPSAVQHQYERETRNLWAVIDAWEYREQNPPLF